MKRLFLIVIAGFLSACGEYKLESEETLSDDCRINVTFRNADEFSSLYPLTLYLFDSDNRCVDQCTVSSEAEIPVLSHASGAYVLSVFSGLSSDEYVYPIEIHPLQTFTFAEGCCSDIPLIVGKSHIQLEQDMQVAVSFSYTVAGLYFSFTSLPVDVSEVTVNVSPVSSGISLAGDINDNRQYATVSCRKEGTHWVAGPVYVLPSVASRIHLSMKLRQGDEETVYGYDYNSSFKSGNIYRFVGKDGGDITLDGENQVTGWNQGIDVELDFEEFVEEDADDWENVPDDDEPENPDEGADDVLYADELPESESIWGPFYVWKAEALSSYSVRATLLAPRQWLVTVDEALPICESYEVDGITNWRIFTLEEAKEFRDQYSSTIVELSEFLFDYGIDRFNKYDIRYLCNDFNSTFCFYNDRISSSGKTVDYGLRLIKTVTVEKE